MVKMSRNGVLALLACSVLCVAQAQLPMSGQSGTSSISPCLSGILDSNCSSTNGANASMQEQGAGLMSVGNPLAQEMASRYSRMLMANGNSNATSNVNSTRPVPPIATKSDFQVFAEDAAGQVLRVYGRDLFDQGPSTFPVVDNIPVPGNYVIGPDDELHVETWGKIDADVVVTVDRNGQIFIPRVGSIGVAGLHYDQLEKYIRAAVAKNFKDFDLNVTLGKLRSIQIYVLGSARQPGEYTVSALSTLVDALFVCGGPSASGSMRSVELRRDAKTAATLDVYDLLRHGDKSGDVKLMPGDVIYIAPMGPQVAVIGNVHDPGIYELKDDLSLATALDNAGGLTVMASTERALLERIENRKMRNVEELALDQFGMHRKLRDGDILRVEPISPKFAGTVMLRGSVAVPGRYAWHDGMRVNDLIPDRESLITRDHWIQQNHIIEYQQNRIAEKQQTQLEQAQLSDEARMNDVRLGISQRAELGEQSAALASTILGNGVQSEQPFDTTTIDINAQQAPQRTADSGVSDRQNGVQSLSSLIGQPSSSQSEQQRSASNNQTSTQSGEYQQNAYQPLDLIADLNLTDAEINWDYAVIERLDKNDLSTRLIPFNLGDAIANPGSDANHALMAGDVITVFSRKDIAMPTEKHSAFIQIEGEVGAPGVYRINPGETLRDAIQRAGGLTPYSYLFAMKLNRISTRKEQQEQLVEMIQRLRKELAAAYANQQQPVVAGASSVTGMAAATGEEASGDQKMFQEQEDLIDRLLTAQVTGRIVLGIPVKARNIDDLPDFHLEDGDYISVPARMDTVQVIGEVYNENALRYRPGRRLAAYLGDTGGPTRTADRGRTFLIRADGTVIGQHALDGFWRSSLGNTVLMPGDAVVVPPKVRMPGGAWEHIMEIMGVTGVLAQSATAGAVLYSIAH